MSLFVRGPSPIYTRYRTHFREFGWAGKPDGACPLGALVYARTGLHVTEMAHQRPGSTLADMAAETLDLDPLYVVAFNAEIDGDDPPAAPGCTAASRWTC